MNQFYKQNISFPQTYYVYVNKESSKTVEFLKSFILYRGRVNVSTILSKIEWSIRNMAPKYLN